MERVRISTFSIKENNYVRDGKEYRAVDLIKLSKDLPVFGLPLIGIDISISPWKNDIKSFVYHAKRIEEAELKYPVILDDTGFICDGWHRVCKAILKGDDTIKAVRLEVMPEPVIINN